MNSNWEYGLYIDTTPAGVDRTWAALGAGIENVSRAMNAVIQQVQYYADRGWGRSRVHGAAPTISLTGQRVVGDVAQDYIFSTDVQYAFGSARETNIKVVEPGGREIVQAVTIAEADESAGESANGNAISITLHTNGAPVITESGEVIGILAVVSLAGVAAGSTRLYINPLLTGGNSYVYRTGAYVPLPAYGANLSSGWTAWNGEDEILATSGNQIVVAEIGATSLAKKAGKATVIANSGA